MTMSHCVFLLFRFGHDDRSPPCNQVLIKSGVCFYYSLVCGDSFLFEFYDVHISVYFYSACMTHECLTFINSLVTVTVRLGHG